MGYIESNLMQGEKIMYEAQLHPIVYWSSIVLCILALCCLFIPFDWMHIAWLSDHAWMVRLILFAIFALVAGIKALETNGGKRYVVTTRRLIFKRGYIRRECQDLVLRKCEGVQTEQTIFGRILNFGSVIVTTGEVTNTYKYIRNPLRFSSAINQMIDNLKVKD